MPRGEVVVGGNSVTAGYFNNDDKTNEVYKVVLSFSCVNGLNLFLDKPVYSVVISDSG